MFSSSLLSNLHSNNLYTCLPSQVIQPSLHGPVPPQTADLLFHDSVNIVYSPSALPSGSVPTAQNVLDDLQGSSRPMVTATSVSQVATMGESAQLNALLMWISSFASLADSFKECLPAGLLAGSLPNVGYRPIAPVCRSKILMFYQYCI